MQNDLISRSELIEYCKKQATEPWNQKAAPVSWADAYVAFADDVEEDFFGVDAVEVVRCWECKNKSPSVKDHHQHLWCRKWRNEVKRNGFCNYGKRRDSDG